MNIFRLDWMAHATIVRLSALRHEDRVYCSISDTTIKWDGNRKRNRLRREGSCATHTKWTNWLLMVAHAEEGNNNSFSAHYTNEMEIIFVSVRIFTILLHKIFVNFSRRFVRFFSGGEFDRNHESNWMAKHTKTPTVFSSNVLGAGKECVSLCACNGGQAISLGHLQCLVKRERMCDSSCLGKC